MKKISIIVLIMIMFYVVANMVWLKVVNNNIDEYLDKDNVSRELISYEGKKTNLEYYIITCNYKGVEKKLNQGEKVKVSFYFFYFVTIFVELRMRSRWMQKYNF